jgi:hypothetical protein
VEAGLPPHPLFALDAAAMAEAAGKREAGHSAGGVPNGPDVRGCEASSAGNGGKTLRKKSDGSMESDSKVP